MRIIKMWTKVLLVLIVMLIALEIVSSFETTFNIYTTSHQLFGKVEPEFIEGIFAILFYFIARRYLKIDIFHQKGGYSHIFKEGWLGIFYIFSNIFLVDNSENWNVFMHHMNAFNLLMIFVIAFIQAYSVGMFEEISVRGIVMGIMLKNFKKYPVMKSIFFSSVIFGCLHAANFFEAPFWDTANQIIYAVGLGFVFGTIYYVTKNIWVSILLHSLIDYSNFVLSVPLTKYTATSSYSGISLVTILTLVLGLISSYLFLIRYNRKQGKKDLLF